MTCVPNPFRTLAGIQAFPCHQLANLPTPHSQLPKVSDIRDTTTAQAMDHKQFANTQSVDAFFECSHGSC